LAPEKGILAFWELNSGQNVDQHRASNSLGARTKRLAESKDCRFQTWRESRFIFITRPIFSGKNNR
jgi:hypothetical protein